MKKFYTLIALAFAAMAVNAQMPVQQDSELPPLPLEGTLPADNKLIDKQPDGTLYKDMYHSANVYVVYGTSSTNRTFDGYVGDVVVSADGKKIYMKDPFIKFAPGTWLEGELAEDGTATFKFPQIIYNKGGVKGYAWKLVIADGNIGKDETVQSVKFNWDGKTLSQVDGNEIIGMLNENDEWMGYGALQASYSVMTDKGAKPADESKALTYRMTYMDQGGSSHTSAVRVVIDGSDIYLGDIYDPDFWVKGTISGNKASFGMQYLGVHANASHLYMVPFDFNQYAATSSLDFTYDATTGSLSTDNAMLINIGKTGLSAVDLIVSPIFNKVDYTVGTPVRPVLAYCAPYGYEGGDYGVMSYQLNPKSTDGTNLNQSNIYYNVYLDGELQTFTTDKYAYIRTDITDVPFDFTDNYVQPFTGQKGLDFVSDQGIQYIFLYKRYSKIGLKAIFVDGDKRYESAMAEYTVTGIDATPAEGKVVKSVTYTDLNGARIATPTHGIYLQTTTYADGEVKTIKVVK